MVCIIKSMYRGDPMKYKKRINISSLSAAICNVALFKSMKERQFKDQIFISYSEDGVILQALNQEEWERAHGFVQSFLETKKISLLAFGFEKQSYEQLIIRGLKEYTRRMKEQAEECPYINIIHYQKLRKSCQYMDKERYVQPLKDWQRKNKKNPNFAFLIVDPIEKFEEVKKNLLEYLLKTQVELNEHYVSYMYFLLLFFSSSIKDQIKQNFDKTYIQVSVEPNTTKKGSQSSKQEFCIKIINYTKLKLDEIDYKVISNSKNLSRLGLQFISSKQIEAQIKKLKLFLPSSVTNHKDETVSTLSLFQEMHQSLNKTYGNDYCVIPFKKSEKQKYTAVINKFTNVTQHKSILQLSQLIQKYIICSEQDIQLLTELNPQNSHQRGYNIYKACINDCPFLIHQYSQLPLAELETFLLYVEQCKTYHCTYLSRFYGISIKYDCTHTNGQVPAGMTQQQKIQNYTYYLIFDYHHRTFQQMIENDMILDNFQIAQMVLQIIYLIYFLHNHDQPRSLGSIRADQVYWPLKIALPYLKNNDEFEKRDEQNAKRGLFNSIGEGFEGDVRMAGQIMKFLINNGDDNYVKEVDQIDDHFCQLMKNMLKESKYERITLQKCISNMEELLQIK